MTSYIPPNIAKYESIEVLPDEWHSAVTITLNELIECGVVDFDNELMKWNAPDEATRKRINSKIVARFGIRQIGIVPPGLWMQQFRRKLNELAPKYKLIWEKIDSEEFNPWQYNREYGKSRHIYSDFPQTMLSGNEDYATAGNDKEFENIGETDLFERAKQIAGAYQDVDAMLLDELEILFSGLVSVNFNGM